MLAHPFRLDPPGEIDDLPGRVSPSEPVAREDRRLPAKGLPEPGVAEKLPDGARQRARVPGGDQEPGAAVFQHLAYLADATRDDRQAAGHVLEDLQGGEIEAV